MKKLLLIISILCLVFSFGCRKEASPNFAFLDDYLKRWDDFAQGANDLAPGLKQDTPSFQTQLAKALVAKDNRAPSRLVFYAVVQVGGYIPVESELGQAFKHTIANEIPVTTGKDGSKVIFAGDLYSWYESVKSTYPQFALYENWKNRDFAQKTVIPMYESVSKKNK